MTKDHGEEGGHHSSNTPLTPALEVPTVEPPVLALQGRRIGNRGDETPPEPDEEIRRLASMITRQASRGFTGETWYDFDLPLNRTDPVVILHFNDVYNIDSREDGSGGVARFVTAMQRFSHLHPLVFFSGDAFNPSLMSTYMKGRQMVPFLNLLKVHTACLGNHDFDFGIDELEYTIGSCNFPWLLTNVFERSSSDDQKKLDKYMQSKRVSPTQLGSGAIQAPYEKRQTEEQEGEEGDYSDDYFGLPGEPIANAWKYRLFEWQGIRIGVIGLVEREWLDTLACISAEDVVYVDYVVAANRMCRFLRAKECELIIALTHMRAPNDQRLAEMAPDIDIILGGHDHDYYGLQVIGGTPVVKSGTDFFDFTAIAIFPGDSSPQPNLLATALIDDSGQRVGAAAIAAAAIAAAPRVLDAPADVSPNSTASAIAAAVAVAEQAANAPQHEELSPSELASQLLHARGRIIPDTRQGQGNREDRPLLLKPVYPAQSQSVLRPSDCRGGSVVIPKLLGKSLVQWERVSVNAASFAKNKHVELLVKKYERHLKQQMRRKLATLGADLETRFRIIRTQESNCGNWLCELMRTECKSDIAFINSGTIRSDCVFKKGDFRYGDLAAMLPMPDELVVVECTGAIILAVLENSVSQVPKTEGRFLQVAGLRFEFDSSKPPGSRIIRETVQVAPRSINLQANDGGPTPAHDDSPTKFEPLQENARYTVVTKSYVLQGRDGFTMMPSCPILVEGELLPPLPTLVRNALALTAMANGLKKPHSRAVSRQLSFFTNLKSDQMLSTFGCKKDVYGVVLAPKCDGRIIDRNSDLK
ncbi:uncharacterized protein LOC34619759 [Cyclospora cayetanensis]|uniref:Uncharacterized protein LOC34619759 n=1 Tax=Cyclospora cayetanensis TaxID=88456 RepID=A0A6P6S0Z1_9EIME|nr:uncharacterized protein LOC34619759 [Cyclospora cayetanensis]